MRIQFILPWVLLSGLAACGGHEDGASASLTVSGVAATGAPLQGATIELRCDRGIDARTVSAVDGRWQVRLPAGSLPCAVKASGGIPGSTFYSFVPARPGTTATADVTPMTDLALSRAVKAALGSGLEDWFAHATPLQRQQVADGLDLAVTQVRAALAAAGYSLPAADFDPFTTAIAAGVAGDRYDELLDAYGQALRESGKSFETARDAFTAGGDVPKKPDVVTPPGSTAVSGPLTAGGASTAAAFFQNLAGAYQLRVTDVVAEGESAGAADEFPKGTIHTVTIQSDGTVVIQGARQTLTYDVTRNGAPQYSQVSAADGEKDELTYFAKSGNGIDLFIRYQPALGFLSVQPAGFTANQEGLATLESQQGPPSVPAAAGTLASQIGRGFAGTYVVSCPQPDKSTVNHTIVIGNDGASTVDGVAASDASHAGQISVEGLGVTAARTDSSQTFPSFLLQFKSDGSIQTAAFNTVQVAAGSPAFCNGVSGSINAAAYDHATVSASFARSEALTCKASSASRSGPSASSPSGSTTFTLASDGSYTLGALSLKPADYKAFSQYKAIDRAAFKGLGNDQLIEAGSSSASGTVDIALDMDAAGKTISVTYQNGFDRGTCTP